MYNKLLLLILAIVVFCSSCAIHDITVSPNETEGINGSGDLVSETRTLTDFNTVHMSTAGQVYVTLGNKQEVSVITDDNIMQYITTTVSNKKLLIGVKNGVQLSNFDLTVNITMTDLEGLIASSAGDIQGKNKFNVDYLSLITSSAGNIRLELEAQQLSSSSSSAGDLYLTGSVKKHQSTLSSAGDLHAFGLITETTTISLSSAGDAEVYVSDKLSATLSSTGSLYYKGSPTINSTVTSVGRIINSN